jgi:hypothetical protein
VAVGASALEDASTRAALALLTRLEGEPIAAVGDPPTHETNGNRCDQCPPDRQNEVCDQSEHGERNPENLLFHFNILVRDGRCLVNV